MELKTNFIPQNTTLKGVRQLIIVDGNNNIGEIDLRTMSLAKKTKLYSFGALSDVHITYDTSETDFQRALIYLNENEDVAFTCVCGDLTSQGISEQLSVYKRCVDTYSPDTPVYSIAGNHESYNDNWTQNGETVVRNLMETYTGKPLYYTFNHDKDVFIMVGIKSDVEGSLFANGELQWLYETLEQNRNKRCFVFQHVRPENSSGNAYNIYKTDIWGGSEATIFESLMSHYKNAHLFHGHSHLRFSLQTKDNNANIAKVFGGWSIHIPSLAAPRTGNTDGTGRTELYTESEGYVVDVYENGIHLRGRDFERGNFLPIASYWLDTTLVSIAAKTYTDTTGKLIL